MGSLVEPVSSLDPLVGQMVVGLALRRQGLGFGAILILAFG